MEKILETKPSPEEYPGHYTHYVDLVPEGNVLDIFESQSVITQNFLSTLTEELGNYSYAFGKWSIKEIIGHLIDTERIFGCRALRIARGDKQPLPGFEQEDYVQNAEFFKRSLSDLVDERLMLRAANIKMFRSFAEEMYLESGMVNDNEITIRAILYLLVGHEIYHLNFIKENYL